MSVPAGKDRNAYTRKEPLGVVGVIWGWNGPMGQLPASSPGPAAGNTVVLNGRDRLAEHTAPAELLAGTTCGRVVNVVNAWAPRRARRWSRTPVSRRSLHRVDRDRQLVQRQAADTLKRTTLELGGKSPSVVFADADSTSRSAAWRPASCTRDRSASPDHGCSSRRASARSSSRSC
ncbi:hypothetical protein GCM10023238_32420 [Streptomyces heliomycini]